MEKKYVVGVDLGGTKIYTALVDLDGTMIKEKTVETLAHEGEGAVLGRILDTISFVIEGTNKDEIKAIGIGSPGPLDVMKGMKVHSANLPFNTAPPPIPVLAVINTMFSVPFPAPNINSPNVATLASLSK